MFPKISIIIPGFNIEKYVRKCLDSICGQTYQNMEIILVDDGSTDSTGAIFDNYAAKDCRIKVVHKINGGVSSARNTGIRTAVGEYILFVDGDDWITKNAVEMLVRTAVERQSDVVLFEYHVEYSDGKNVEYQHNELEGNMTIEQAIYNTLIPLNRFAVTKLYKREIIKDNFFDESIHLGEDTLFACRAICNSKKIFFLAQPLYHYIQSAGSATRKTFFDKRMLTGKKAYWELVELCQKHFPKIEDVALTQYLEILMSIIIDMYKAPKENSEHIREFGQEIRKYSLTVFKSQTSSIASKIKILLCCIHPTFMVGFRKLSKRVSEKTV